MVINSLKRSKDLLAARQLRASISQLTCALTWPNLGLAHTWRPPRRSDQRTTAWQYAPRALCPCADEVKHVEVKGTTEDGAMVLLIPNEVRHTRENPCTALFVLSDVKVEQAEDGTINVTGGVRHLNDPWHIDDGTLIPLGFRYQVPARERPIACVSDRGGCYGVGTGPSKSMVNAWRACFHPELRIPVFGLR